MSIGLNDEVKCFYCGKIAHQWKAKDDPWIKHDDISPNCEFLRILDMNETKYNIPLAIDMEERYLLNNNDRYEH